MGAEFEWSPSSHAAGRGRGANPPPRCASGWSENSREAAASSRRGTPVMFANGGEADGVRVGAGESGDVCGEREMARRVEGRRRRVDGGRGEAAAASKRRGPLPAPRRRSVADGRRPDSREVSLREPELVDERLGRFNLVDVVAARQLDAPCDVGGLEHRVRGSKLRMEAGSHDRTCRCGSLVEGRRGVPADLKRVGRGGASRPRMLPA